MTNDATLGGRRMWFDGRVYASVPRFLREYFVVHLSHLDVPGAGWINGERISG